MFPAHRAYGRLRRRLPRRLAPLFAAYTPEYSAPRHDYASKQSYIRFAGLLALALLAPLPAFAAQITIGFLGPADADAVEGAQQAIDDDNTTGKFVGQSFVLKDGRGADPAQSLRAMLAAGIRLVVADLPAPQLLALADMPDAKDVTFFNSRAAEDSLRAGDCRRNVLHTAPSRAMLADALVQYMLVKKWSDLFLVTGPNPADQEFAAAIKHSITKFRAKLVAEKPWTYAPGAKRSDSGHYAIGAQIAEFTQGVKYDVLIVADEAGAFGDELPYATSLPRPVAGTQGLFPTAWTASHEEWGATQLQNRVLHKSGKPLGERGYAAWLAVRAVGEAATRENSADAAQIAAYLKGERFELPGYKGEPLSFRPWDGQMRQAILLADAHRVVSVSPQKGFLHPTTELDSLGYDKPETQCHAR
jgi:ABC transporter substrate binding protein (PQQ-dependent alcohol dehydrogenase system)